MQEAKSDCFLPVYSLHRYPLCSPTPVSLPDNYFFAGNSCLVKNLRTGSS